MAHRIFERCFRTKEEAEEAARINHKPSPDPYREVYLRRGPYEAVSTNGEPIWCVKFEEYSG